MPQYNVVIVFSTDNAAAADEFASDLAATMDGAHTDIVMNSATMTAEDNTVTDLMLEEVQSQPAASSTAASPPATGDEPASSSLPTGKEF